MSYEALKNLAASNEGSEGFISVGEELFKEIVYVMKKRGVKVDLKAKDLGGRLYSVSAKAFCEVTKALTEEDKNLAEIVSSLDLDNLIKTKTNQ